MSPSDHELLRRYADEKSHLAFATLVERHVGLVYSVARRIVRSPQLAEDVAQVVFIDLARNAPAIKPGAPLVAWLHVVSRRTSVDVVRRESRRQAREAAAAQLAETPAMKTSASEWMEIESLLDEAVESLDASDRHAILLRFFENKSLREVGSALGVSDDTAQKRVSRALDQLRDFFARRGAPVTAAAIAADLSAHVMITAPATLGSSITAAVLGSVSTVAVPYVAITLAQKTLGSAAAAAVLGVVAYYAILRPTSPPTPPAVAQVATTETTANSTALVAPAPPITSAPRAIPGSPEDMRVALLRQLFVDLPAQNLPELRLLTPADWAEVARAHELDSAADIRVALAKLRSVARKKFATHLQTALRRFTNRSGGVLPDDIAQLTPHLDAPADAEMLARYALKRTGRLGASDEELVAETPTSDVVLTVGLDSWQMRNNSDYAPAAGETETDTLERAAKAIGNALGPDGPKLVADVAGGMPALTAMIEDVAKSLEQIYATSGGEEAFGVELKKAVRQFTAAHPGEPVTDLGQIMPFFPGAEKLMTLARTDLAPINYLLAHPGQPPPNAEQLRRYLADSPDLTTAFKGMKLVWDGEHLTVSFNFNWSKEKD